MTGREGGTGTEREDRKWIEFYLDQRTRSGCLSVGRRELSGQVNRRLRPEINITVVHKFNRIILARFIITTLLNKYS